MNFILVVEVFLIWFLMNHHTLFMHAPERVVPALFTRMSSPSGVTALSRC